MLFWQLLIGFLVNFGVAPLAGAWIEILRRRMDFDGLSVAPLAGAWTEIEQMLLYHGPAESRSPRRSVD